MFEIITMEGDDPTASWAQIISTMPPEFAEFAADVHGLDVNAPKTYCRQYQKKFFDSRA